MSFEGGRGAASERVDLYFTNERREPFLYLPRDGVRRVLSLGCATGATEKRLKAEFELDQVVGVEYEPEVAELAREHLDEVHVGDIEKMELPYDEGHFDAVLCLDVLEHVVDPWGVLERRVAPLVRPGGWVLVSVPNVGFWPVVWRLLRGRWSYAPHGILDTGHLRFFTVPSARALVADAGFDVARLERRYRIWEPHADRMVVADEPSATPRRRGIAARLERVGFFRVFFFLRNAFTYQTVVLGQRPEI